MLNWNELTDIKQLQEIIHESARFPVAIYKHSIWCGTSTMIKNRLERTWDLGDEGKVYFLDLINHRKVSNAVEMTFGVKHESPQLILVDKGKVVYHASHLAISVADIKAAVRQLV